MNKKSLLFLLVLFSLLVFSSGSYAELGLATNYYLEKGKKDFAIKEYDLAITDFNKALLADPNNEEALMYLRMLGFSSGGENDKISRREQGESFNKEAESVKVQKVADNKPVKKKALTQEAQPENLTIKEIEMQTAKEEKAALQAVRIQAAEKEKVALKKIHSQKNNGQKQKEQPLEGKGRNGAVANKASKAAVEKVSDDVSAVASEGPHDKNIKQVKAESQQKVVKKNRKIVGGNLDSADAQQQEALLSYEEGDKDVQAKAEQEKKVSLKASKKKAGKTCKKDKAVCKEKVSAKKSKVKAEEVEPKNSLGKVGEDGDLSLDSGHGDLSAEKKASPVSGVSDVMKGDDSIAVGELSEHGQKTDAQKVPAMSSQEETVRAELREELAQKEKDIRREFAQKKAARIRQAQKVLPVKTAKTNVNKGSSLDGEPSVTMVPEDVELAMVSDPSVKEAVAAAKSENVILKKKLAAIVEMSQQDQQTIKDLEKNTKTQSKKVAALESDLAEAIRALEAKKAANKEQEEKLKGLQARINALESDVHSNKYDFKDKQLEYEKKIQAIEDEFGNYKSQKANSEEDLKEQLRILKEALAKKIAELNDAQDRLIFLENKLKTSEAKQAQTVKQYEDVKKTLSDLESRLANLQTKMTTDDVPLVKVDPKNLPLPRDQNEVVYQQWIQRHDKLVTKLKEKLLWAREQMDYLGRYDIMLSDQKMAVLKEQLAAVKKQLSDSAVPNQKSGDYLAMEERLKDAQQRLEMVEKILREKEEQNRELEKQLNGVLSAF